LSPSDDLPGDGSPASPEEEAPPVAALNDFEEDVSDEFVPRLRRRLHRRIFTGQVTQFSFNVPGMLLREFIQMIFELLPPRASRSSNSQSSNSGPSSGIPPRQENRP
jgi:hypothetical protein